MSNSSGWRLVHATALLVGPRAVLIRGRSGIGKSRLAYAIMGAASRRGRLARLLADDYVLVMASEGRLVARAPETIAGLLEIRGIGIVRVAHEPIGALGLVVDLSSDGPLRMPEQDLAVLETVAVPRLALRGDDPNAAEIVLDAAAHFFELPRSASIAGFAPSSPSWAPPGEAA
jgi:HPr kinase/phosphorylase